MKTVVFIDGENFLHKVRQILKGRDISSIKVKDLIHSAVKPIKTDKVIFYAARLHEHPDFIEKSKELIEFQRRLKTNLEKQGIEFIIAGNVRGQPVPDSKKVIFHEKGVDVRIAVDMVSLACDGGLKTAIVCSSDSDLQPAIKELRKRNVEVVYLGFEIMPNKGLMFTSNKTVLFREAEVLKALDK